MDAQHHHPERRIDIERGTAAEHAHNWRQSLHRLHKNPTVRRHERCWLLGLITFGPIR